MDILLIIGMAVLATAVGGYLAASLILFKFPQLVHKRKKLKIRPVHISHKGGSGENCENTLAAFKHALNQGTDMLELDCRLTRDGEVVVFHDQHLLNKCGTDVEIADLDFKDLPEYKPVLTVDFRPDFTVECGDDRRIPTLREVFQAFPETPLNIDIKVYDENLLHKVNNLIKEFNREDLTVWGGPLSDITKGLYKLNPDIPVFFSYGRELVLFLLFYSGLLPFIPLFESTLQVAMPSVKLNKSYEHAQLSWTTKAKHRLGDFFMMRPALFRHLERRGIQTYIWVLNEEQEWDRAFKLGATGIITDFPTKLTEYIRQHPELIVDAMTSNDIAEDSPLKSTLPED